MLFSLLLLLLPLTFGLTTELIQISPSSVQLIDPESGQINRQIIFKLNFNREAIILPQHGYPFLFSDLYENYVDYDMLLYVLFEKSGKRKEIVVQQWKMDHSFFRKYFLKGENLDISVGAGQGIFFKFTYFDFKLQVRFKPPSHLHQSLPSSPEFPFNFLTLASTLATDQLQMILNPEERKIVQNPYTVHELNQLRDGQKMICKKFGINCALPKKLKEKNWLMMPRQIRDKELYDFLFQLLQYFTTAPSADTLMPPEKCIQLTKGKNKLFTMKLKQTLQKLGLVTTLLGITAAIITGIVYTGGVSMIFIGGLACLGVGYPVMKKIKNMNDDWRKFILETSMRADLNDFGEMRYKALKE